MEVSAAMPLISMIWSKSKIHKRGGMNLLYIYIEGEESECLEREFWPFFEVEVYVYAKSKIRQQSRWLLREGPVGVVAAAAAEARSTGMRMEWKGKMGLSFFSGGTVQAWNLYQGCRCDRIWKSNSEISSGWFGLEIYHGLT